LLDGSRRRVCPHYLHMRCANALPNKTCPMCRAAFNQTAKMPSIEEDARLWFTIVDADGNGSLSPVELIEALKTQLPVDWKKLEEQMVPGMWAQFDPDGDGGITFDELVRPNGVITWIKKTFPHRDRPPCPPITSKDEWFSYWDEDDSAELDQAEAVRALSKTFKLSHDLARVRTIRETVAAVWMMFDTDGGGGIDREEFVKRDGFADTIIASTT